MPTNRVGYALVLQTFHIRRGIILDAGIMNEFMAECGVVAFGIAERFDDFLLHKKKKLQSQLFIDRHMTYRRDGYASGGVDYQEVEANQFGAALLMPRSLVQQEVKRVTWTWMTKKRSFYWRGAFA